MKRILNIFSFAVLAASLFFSACSNGTGGGDDGVSGEQVSIGSDEIAIHLMYADTSKSWNLWAWKVSSDTNYTTASWPGNLSMSKDPETGGFYYVLKPDTSDDLGLLFVDSSASVQTSDITISKDKLVGGSHFYFIYGSSTIYSSSVECKGVKTACISSADGKTVKLGAYGLSKTVSSDYNVKDSEGTVLTVSNVEATESSVVLTLSSADISKRPYTVTYGDTTISANITGDVVESLDISYSGDDLGLVLNGTSATFKVWAPIATKVTLLLYTDSSKIGNFKQSTVDAKASGSCDESELRGTPGTSVDMTSSSSNGVWSATNVDVSSYKYYKFEIVNNGETYYVCDINAKVCAADSIAAEIVDINSTDCEPDNWETSYTNPFGNNNTDTMNYTDAVIYEMHIRDWAKAYGSTNTGKFEEITDALNDAEGFAAHLTDLGITHVQILPMFDYAQVNADTDYNWGYNPYHYNVPEGRYVNYGDTEKKDGKYAVIQMREMIKAFHDAGIAVNMDVVFNHTSGSKGGSLYDSTVPEYFYRVTDGSYSNGSGCGNEIATEHKMVEKYIIDSLKHWMNDYHINGFRFDLMGLADTQTMADIYDALHAIDKNVMVYGEPWTGGTSSGENLVTKSNIDDCVSTTLASENGVACFNDDFRNAVKGAEYPSFTSGHVSGEFNDSAIVAGLIGSTGSSGFTSKIGRSINYAECHDNNTLADKLAMIEKGLTSYSGKILPGLTATQLADVKAQDKLAAAYVLLSQGIPFIDGGQEFMRTKRCDSNSYKSDDKYNAIDLSFKTTYADVYNTYRGLIKLRQYSCAFTDAENVTATTVSTGLTKYCTADNKDCFTVYFNANTTDRTISEEGYVVTVDDATKTEDGFSIATEKTTETTVPAKSFVILKK